MIILSGFPRFDAEWMFLTFFAVADFFGKHAWIFITKIWRNSLRRNLCLDSLALLLIHYLRQHLYSNCLHFMRLFELLFRISPIWRRMNVLDILRISWFFWVTCYDLYYKDLAKFFASKSLSELSIDLNPVVHFIHRMAST